MSLGSALLTDLGRSDIGVLYGSGAIASGTVADGNEAVQEISVPGAELGDFVILSSSVDVADISLVGQVTAKDVVTAQVGNWSGGNLSLTGTIYCLVLKNPMI